MFQRDSTAPPHSCSSRSQTSFQSFLLPAYEICFETLIGKKVIFCPRHDQHKIRNARHSRCSQLPFRKTATRVRKYPNFATFTYLAKLSLTKTIVRRGETGRAVLGSCTYTFIGVHVGTCFRQMPLGLSIRMYLMLVQFDYYVRFRQN